MNNTEDTNDTRLPMVAWWLKNSGGEKDLVGLGSGEHIYQGAFDEKIFLCRLTDAQALLAEKDARIAELERQATMDGGLARLALNAAKDQLASAEAALDKAQALNVEQLAQLQSAPAERELSLLREYRLSAIAFNNSHGWEPDTLEEAVELERKAEERLEAAEKACWEFYRLNPAPATADSGMRGAE